MGGGPNPAPNVERDGIADELSKAAVAWRNEAWDASPENAEGALRHSLAGASGTSSAI